jgi:hypothetical protein
MPFGDKSIRSSGFDSSLKLYIDLLKLLTYVSYQDIISSRRRFITDNYEINMLIEYLVLLNR